MNTAMQSEDLEEDLRAHGWVHYKGPYWRAPEGTLHIGPFGAWKMMRARHHGIDTLTESELMRAAPEQYVASTYDWFQECREVHGGACELDRYRHMTRMQMEKTA